jgi:hypothetical protein
MTILEIQGIRCSARNFQLELEVKQMMTMNPVNLFETCLFTKSTLGIGTRTKTPVLDEEDQQPPKEEAEEEEKEDEKVLESLAESSLDEVDIEIPKEKEEMKLKKRNYVYYNMYKEAKRKAKIARDFAIASYLEAKQIRNNFLEETDLSEDDDVDKLGNELEVLG